MITLRPAVNSLPATSAHPRRALPLARNRPATWCSSCRRRPEGTHPAAPQAPSMATQQAVEGWWCTCKLGCGGVHRASSTPSPHTQKRARVVQWACGGAAASPPVAGFGKGVRQHAVTLALNLTPASIIITQNDTDNMQRLCSQPITRLLSRGSLEVHTAQGRGVLKERLQCYDCTPPHTPTLEVSLAHTRPGSQQP